MRPTVTLMASCRRLVYATGQSCSRSSALLSHRLYHSSKPILSDSVIPSPLSPSESTPLARFRQQDIASFEDIENLYWKAPYLHAWLQSFQHGDNQGLIELDRHVFGMNPIRQDLIKRALDYERSWMEQGTESSKSLGQVRGSTRKPFPQKGRGKARVGTMRAPNFRGGYTVHGDKPHLKTIDLQRKVYDAAIRHALSAKFLQSQLVVVDSLHIRSFSLEHALTAHALQDKSIYIMYGNEEPERKLIRMADELERRRPLLVTSARHVSVTPLMKHEIVVVDKLAVEVLEEMYKLE